MQININNAKKQSREWVSMALCSLFLALTCLALNSSITHASELPEFYRGVRAEAMGEAFTAIADDEDAIFYNPAGLAFMQKISLQFLNPKLAASKDDISSITAFKDTSSGLTSSTISKIFGKNLYGAASVFPSIYLPNFGLGYYYSADFHLVARNLSYPSISAKYTIDKGLVSGFGFETRGFSKLHYLRWGVGLKMITRQGFDGYIPVTKLATVDTSYLKSLQSDPATGIGLTLGFQYDITLSRSDTFVIASAWQDVGDTRFGNRYTTNTPDPIYNNLSAGGAYIHRFSNAAKGSRYNLKLSGEGRHLMQQNIDPRLRMHFGTEFQFGNFAIQGGVNQNALTGGFTADLWLMKISAVTYAVNTQALAGLDRERRYMLQITFGFDMPGYQNKTLKEDDRYRYPRKFN